MNYIDPFENKTNIKEIKDHSSEVWVNTYSGRKFFPLNANINSIVIQDISHSLSQICRFTGHTKEFYSVAQHCVLVSYICDQKDRLYGLLHDASEYVLTDLPTPLKRSGEFDNYLAIENKLQAMIYKRFGLYENEPVSVKIADKIMLATEARDLLENMHPDWKMEFDPLPFRIVPLSPKEAETMFIRRFNELFLANEKLKR